MEIKKLFEKLPFKPIFEKAAKKIPFVAKIVPWANYIASGIIAVVFVIIFAVCFGGKTSDIKFVKNAVFNYDKSLKFDQAVKGMNNAKKHKYYKQKDEKGRRQVVVEITIDDCDKFFFPSFMYNQQLYPSETSGGDFDETITEAFVSFGKSATALGDEMVKTLGIDYETAVNYVNELTEWKKENGKYPIKGKKRYFSITKSVLKAVVTFEGKGKKRTVRITDGLLSFDIKTAKGEKIRLRIPLEGDDCEGILPMIYKDKSWAEAMQE